MHSEVSNIEGINLVLSQTHKQLIVSGVLGAIAGTMTWYRAASETAHSLASEYLGLPVDLVLFLSDLIGLGAHLQQFRDFMLGPLLGLTAGLVIFLLLALWKPLRSILARWWPAAPDILDDNLSREQTGDLSAFSSGVGFVGRELEMRELMMFAGRAKDNSPCIKWILGREGIGKTRISVEWLRKLKTYGWDVGLLRPDVTALTITRTRFRRKTAILIDEPATWPDIWSILEALASSKKNIAVLVADHIHRPMPETVSRDKTTAIARATQPPIRLSGLSDEEISTLWYEKGTVAKGDIEGRPLFAILSNLDEDEVFRRAAKRIETAKDLGGDRTLLIACLAGPVRRSATLSEVGATIPVGSLQKIFESEDKTFLRGTLPRVTPSLIADEITLRLASEEGVSDLDDIIAVCIQENQPALEQRLGSL